MIRIIFIIAMLYCDAATFCRRRNDAGIMTDETGRRCAQESIDIIIMKNKYYYLLIKNNFDYLLMISCCRFTSVGKRISALSHITVQNYVRRG